MFVPGLKQLETEVNAVQQLFVVVVTLYTSAWTPQPLVQPDTEVIGNDADAAVATNAYHELFSIEPQNSELKFPGSSSVYVPEVVLENVPAPCVNVAGFEQKSLFAEFPHGPVGGGVVTHTLKVVVCEPEVYVYTLIK